ncbi:alpha-L-rhamnosidase C-terminal domain-containing protein [Kiritimatiellaeota bacterium B1221]|nr:alpha-L-rhamnosidase C-terminal domain-containing protein [Kiritimatiellaeota bacterium B1221]
MKSTVQLQALTQIRVAAQESHITPDECLFLDFGKAAFGTLLLPASSENWVVHLGEQLNEEGRLQRNPEGCIRYIRVEQAGGSAAENRVKIPPDERNTGPAAIRMPAEIGEVFPFRYAEIEAGKGVDPFTIRQVRVHYPFNDQAAAFQSSDVVLNAVWDLCKYTIKATTFCGVYVDGDRERIPYEGDAYINQLGHYCVDQEYDFARYSHEYLLQNPTWPTDWQLHAVMMAWADYLYSGEKASLDKFYDDLCVKTLIELAREDGLISTQSEKCNREFERRLHMHGETFIVDHGMRDLVDWPPGSFTDGGIGERDNHEMLPVNTVVNAFHVHALNLMSRIANVLGKAEDEQRFSVQADKAATAIQEKLFDVKRGVYVDGEGSVHASLHSNMFMLAFDLVPEERKAQVVEFVKSRGMACSVYGAQYLLEALYLNHEGQAALELMNAQHDRSWWNMIQSGSTMTWEAWDIKYKGNLDWNHAWGAVPANILPRFLLGVRPLEPGFRKVMIQPQPGSLKQVSGKVPTPHGPITVTYEYEDTGCRVLNVELPENVEGVVQMEGSEGVPQVLGSGKHMLMF